MSKTRVLIADDHALVREGIAAFLRLCDDIEVVGEASDGLEAIEKTNALKPDVVIMDINMPKFGGLEATIEVKKMSPDTKILVLTQYDDKEYISRFLSAGVSGYLLKRAVGSDLVTALRAVRRGELYLHSSIASEVVAGFLGKELQHLFFPVGKLLVWVFGGLSLVFAEEPRNHLGGDRRVQVQLPPPHGPQRGH